MACGTVVENLSNRKLFAILTALFFAQVLFFMLGAIYAPAPSSSMEFQMTRCRDKSAGKSNKWFHLRPKECVEIKSLDTYVSTSSDVRDIVFVAQMPHARQGVELEYSEWFQFLLGFLEFEIEYDPAYQLVEKALLELEVRMAFRRKTDSVDQWLEFISTTVQRTLECHIDSDKRNKGFHYNCSTIDLFQLGANPYPFYLLNLRIPANQTRCQKDPKAANCAIGRIQELRLIAVHQNGGFTLIWLWMKTLIFPIVLLALYWYYKRVQLLNRPKFLIEKSILALGCAIALLDLPIEWISLWFPTPAHLIIGDIRQGLFYAVLFSFWLIFAGEHLIDDTSRNNLKNYWRNLSFVLTASFAMLAYDIAERGMQLWDPFFTVWSSQGSRLASLFVFLAIVSIAIYFCFLGYKIFKVWTTIKRKRSAQLYKMSENRRLQVEVIIYRFKFLMLLTLVCAALTIVSYTMQQYNEDNPLIDDDDDTAKAVFTHSASAFFTGVFGMWNIYVILLLSMYAPSHKHYANAQTLEDENEDLMDPTSSSAETESTPMTTFFKPATD